MSNTLSVSLIPVSGYANATSRFDRIAATMQAVTAVAEGQARKDTLAFSIPKVSSRSFSGSMIKGVAKRVSGVCAASLSRSSVVVARLPEVDAKAFAAAMMSRCKLHGVVAALSAHTDHLASVNATTRPVTAKIKAKVSNLGKVNVTMRRIMAQGAATTNEGAVLEGHLPTVVPVFSAATGCPAMVAIDLPLAAVSVIALGDSNGSISGRVPPFAVAMKATVAQSHAYLEHSRRITR